MGRAARANPTARSIKANGRTSDHITMLLLRRRARQITTREQFERILAAARHPIEIRRLLEPLLEPNLPCCALRAVGKHTSRCPSRRLLEELVDAG